MDVSESNRNPAHEQGTNKPRRGSKDGVQPEHSCPTFTVDGSFAVVDQTLRAAFWGGVVSSSDSLRGLGGLSSTSDGRYEAVNPMNQ